MAVIGVDLGGTKIATALFDNSGEIILKNYRLLDGREGEDVALLALQSIQEILDHTDEQIRAVGICIPGIVYSKTGTVWAPNIPGWDNFPLKRFLEENLKSYSENISVNIESDRTCYILGEIWRGAAKGCDNAIYLAVGTGIGAGIVIDGRVLHGASDIVGATGWMALSNPYHPDYIQCGCFEHIASGTGIAVQARKLLLSDKNYKGEMSSKKIEDVSSYDVFSGYEKRDRIAVRVLEGAIEMWGMGSANLVSLFNPEKVIFGGGVFGPAVEFIPRIYDEACKWGQPIAMKQVEFVSSALGSEAALYGAGYLALKFKS